MNCPVCGGSGADKPYGNSETQDFCPTCKGTGTTLGDAPTKCIDCGADLHLSDILYCGDCSDE